MLKAACFYFTLAISLFANSQNTNIPVSNCLGAINVFENGEFSLQFTGKKTSSLDKAYPSLKDKTSDNQIWCSYLAAEDGELNFQASVENNSLKMIIFKEEVNDICGEIERGIAEIQRIQTGKDFKVVGLEKEMSHGMMYPMKLKAGEKIHVVFFSEEKSTESMSLNWNFVSENQEVFESKVLDLRDDDFAPTLSIKIRDVESKRPLIGNLTMNGAKELSALYVGSDFYFNINRKLKLVLQCDVPGYFFKDVELDILTMEDKEITIDVEKIAKGKKIKFEEIEFKPGTSIITEASEPKLSRLKDFLALNSDVKIEIHGHVHSTGKNTIGAQRMSEARAKQILKFLVGNGIDKTRLSAFGFGNTQPVFEEAKFSYEEQANRRVEVVIL